jgi:quinol monooxygenase YgiN
MEDFGMICVLATIEVGEGCRDDLLALFRDLTPKVLAEKGCIEYAPMIDTPSQLDLQGALRPNVVVMVEKWESVAALQSHLATPHMAEFGKQAAKLRVGLTLQVLAPA